jgi:hypothetical protein
MITNLSVGDFSAFRRGSDTLWVLYKETDSHDCPGKLIGYIDLNANIVVILAVDFPAVVLSFDELCSFTILVDSIKRHYDKKRAIGNPQQP